MSYVMQSWPVPSILLIFFGLVVPSLLAGGFQPALVRQKVVEMSLPIGVIGTEIMLVRLLGNLSDPSHVTPAVIGLLSYMALWGGFYLAARLIKTQPLHQRTPFNARSILPVVAVLSMLVGWWSSAVLANGARTYISTEGIVGFMTFFGGLTLLRHLRNEQLDVMTMAKVSVQAGCLTMLTGFAWMALNLDDPSRVGPGMAMGLLGGLYSLLLYQILILLSPLSPHIHFKKPGVGMVYGYLFHMVFLISSWALLMALLD
jgi:hypothetical protein